MIKGITTIDTTIATKITTATATTTATTSQMTWPRRMRITTEIGQGQQQDGTRRMRRSSKGVRGVQGGSGGRPPGETDGIVADEPPIVTQPTLLPLAENAQDATLFPASAVSKDICQEITLLLSAGVSTDQSKLVSKEFPLTFEKFNL
jgi:hypothetical protein